MPVANRQPPGNTDDTGVLRPYEFHSIACPVRPGATHAAADCPFCGRAGKLAVCLTTGLWRCLVCAHGTDAGGGNALVFVRSLYERAVATTPDEFLAEVAADRGLARPDTVRAWGVCRSPIDGSWLLPGYGTDGRLNQLYRRVRVTDKGKWVWRMLPTPGLWTTGKQHALHLPVGDFDSECPDVYVCEGPWDGMVMWETACGSKISPCQIIAVPGCNVWRDDWTEFCRNKVVTVMFDSDHPRVEGKLTFRSGYDGVRRVARAISATAAIVKWLRWGPDGYDPDRPDGWDVRDHITTAADRQAALDDIVTKVEEVPSDWVSRGSSLASSNGRSHTSIEPIECSQWSVCESAWDAKRDGSMYWRQDMSDALAVILAVCASTNQSGNQLFMDLVGAPGSAKTTILRGALTSQNCVHVENITKIISGYKKAGEDTDCSFIARSNKKTWVTCEFDVILTSSQYVELMGKIRRIFDGETTSTYGNSNEDRLYAALRTPWIRAGTFRMMDHDQSQLGDRFLRLIINDPGDDEKRAIARSALRSERVAMLEACNGTAGSIVDPRTRRAYALTGGYVDWLRANVEDCLSRVQCSDITEDRCLDMAELSADLRARPNEDKRKKEDTDGKELPTRLARQYIRLACHLAVVLNKREVDNEVLRIVRKVALDTAHGHSLNIVRWLCSTNPKSHNRVTYQESGGLMDGSLSIWLRMTPDRLANYMMFLSKIGVVQLTRNAGGASSWILTDRVRDLYMRVIGR